LSASLCASTARRRSVANCNSEPRSHERWLELPRRPLRRRASSCSGSPALVCHRSILEAFDVQFSMRNLDSQAPVEACLVRWCTTRDSYSEIQGTVHVSSFCREALVLLRLRRLDLADCAGEDPLARDRWTRRFRGSLRLGHSCWLCVFAAAHRRHGLGAAAAVRYQPSIRYPACRDMDRTVPPPPRPTVTSCIRA
jgi:hypothetical protein